MTDSNRADELPALMEERRKYESWLAALEARRESTAPHVFDRVKADYQSRMQQVETRLAAHRQSIEEERTSLESRRALLAAEEQLRRDERAELELRAHVGELAGSDSESAFRAVDDSLGKLTEERGVLTKRIDELDALLAGRVPAAGDAEVKAERVDAGASEPTPEPAAASASEQPAPEMAPQPEPETETPGEPHAPTIPRTPGGRFDELAFVSELIGAKDAKGAVAPDASVAKGDVTRDESASESLLHGLRDKSSAESPLAANVPANTPIVLRPSGSIEQSKTLKCNECGAMNYPTEWYCERCGAELAAL